MKETQSQKTRALETFHDALKKYGFTKLSERTSSRQRRAYTDMVISSHYQRKNLHYVDPVILIKINSLEPVLRGFFDDASIEAPCLSQVHRLLSGIVDLEQFSFNFCRFTYEGTDADRLYTNQKWQQIWEGFLETYIEKHHAIDTYIDMANTFFRSKKLQSWPLKWPAFNSTIFVAYANGVSASRQSLEKIVTWHHRQEDVSMARKFLNWLDSYEENLTDLQNALDEMRDF